MAEIILFETAQKQNVLIEASNGPFGEVADAKAPKLSPPRPSLDALFEPPDGEVVTRGAVASNIIVAAQTSFEDAFAAVESTLESLHASIARVAVPLDQIEVSFGLKLTAGAHAIISAGTEANFQFTVSWKPNHMPSKSSEPQ